MTLDPLVDALAALGLRLGEPLRVDESEMVPATCLRCKRGAWHWPAGSTADGSAMLFDAESIDGETFLALHGCHFEDGTSEVDEPMWEGFP